MAQTKSGGVLAKVALALSLVAIIPGVPVIGAVLGAVSCRRAPKDTRPRGITVAAIIVGSVFFLLQLAVVPLGQKAWRQHKKCLVLEPIDRIIELSEAFSLEHRQSGVPVFPTARTEWTPHVTGCGLFAVADQWSAPAWRLIGFRLEQTRYHIQFRYESDGKSLSVVSRADLNCDGRYSTWERKVEVTPSGGFINTGPFFGGDPEDWK